MKRLLSKNHRCRPGGDWCKSLITIHSTGNPYSTAQGERNWLDNPTNTREASWHYVVDENEIIQAIPDSEEAWHCGNKDGNRFSIGIEICESGDREKTLRNAAIFTANKLKELKLSADDMVRHYDWTKKDCPRILIDKRYIKGGMDWQWFKGEVERNMEKRYNTIDEVPEWGQPAIQELINKGCFADVKALNLSEDMVRVFVIMERKEN